MDSRRQRISFYRTRVTTSREKGKEKKYFYSYFSPRGPLPLCAQSQKKVFYLFYLSRHRPTPKLQYTCTYEVTVPSALATKVGLIFYVCQPCYPNLRRGPPDLDALTPPLWATQV
jgi:hypothetical protein